MVLLYVVVVGWKILLYASIWHATNIEVTFTAEILP